MNRNTRLARARMDNLQGILLNAPVDHDTYKPGVKTKLSRLEQKDSQIWLNTVLDIPVGQIVQYRNQDGKVVYWHLRQKTLQATSKKTCKGTMSKVRAQFIEQVNNGNLFITHV